MNYYDIENHMVIGEQKEDIPIYKCCECEEELYLYDEIWDIEGDIYCEDCGEKQLEEWYKRTINEDDIDIQKGGYC